MEKKEVEEKPIKMGFFKKVWYSITKIEKYQDMSAQGLGKAISYLAKIVAILAIIICLGTIYQINNLVQEGAKYLKDEFPEITYNNGTLTVNSENEITIPKENSIFGTVIINTNELEETQINQYTNSVTEEGKGIVILKDKLIIKNASVSGTVTYNYKEMLEPVGINEFNKQTILSYTTGTNLLSVYISLFIVLFVYAFIMYAISILADTLLLSFFGYITTKLARIKMRYVAIYNMSVYALTLSIILNMIYIAINAFVPITITYFQVMYVAVAAIYLVAAILIFKADVAEKLTNLMRILETQEEEEKRESEKEKEKRERQKKDKEEEENIPDGQEGSNA